MDRMPLSLKNTLKTPLLLSAGMLSTLTSGAISFAADPAPQASPDLSAPVTAPPPPLENFEPSPLSSPPEPPQPPTPPSSSAENTPTPTPETSPEPTQESLAETPAPPPAEPPPAENVVVAEPPQRKVRYPAYQQARPAWGVQVTGSAKALGGTALLASQQGGLTRAFEIQGEYQPPILQDYGVLGIGPSVGIYPITPTKSVTPSIFSLWEVGGQIRYQGRFFREQPIVPIVGYELQYFNYRFSSGPSGHFFAQGPTFGGMFLLNVIEPTTAAEFYINQGIARSYLVAELKNLSGNDENLSFSGLSFFFGLRLEF